MAFQVTIKGKPVAEFSTLQAAEQYATTELDATDVYAVVEVPDVA